VRVAIVHGDGRLVVEVADDSVSGADPSWIGPARPRRPYPRALGELTVDSPPGGGTRIRADPVRG
jgi:hypothetical protein